MQHVAPTLSLVPPDVRRLRIGVALAIVYFVWGSTYYALKIGLETFSPFLLAGPRFLAAGGGMYVFLRARGIPSPTLREWVDAANVGALLLVCGNGGVVLAQGSVSTSAAAIVVATMPIWAALFGPRPSRREAVGLALGLSGVALLHAGGSLRFDPAGIFLLLAPVCWALGSVLSKRIPSGPMGTAAQMLTAGAIMLTIGLLRGERFATTPSGRSLVAVLYLSVVGSIVALSAYQWLLRNVRPAVATSYAFVNPLVALGFGVLLAHEGLSVPTILAVMVSLAGVAVIVRRR